MFVFISNSIHNLIYLTNCVCGPGFNYDDRLKTEAGTPLTSLPDSMPDFRQHCIKPSSSPGPGGEDAGGLHHPHMGEFNMGEEQKEEGGVAYGGAPEMGSWQMPGRNIYIY